MKLTSIFAAFALSGALALTACGSREGEGADKDPTGKLRPDPDPVTDNGTPMTLAQLRAAAAESQFVEVSNVVVSHVEKVSIGDKKDVRADFWVVDPNDPKSGIWVQKFYQDTATGHPDANGTRYEPARGDVVTLRGYYEANTSFNASTPYRLYLRSNVADNSRRLQIVLLERKGKAGEPAPVEVPAGFGNAQGGTVAVNPEYLGGLVHVGGALEITNLQPEAMARRDIEGKLTAYAGFEITGGVLVNTFWTKAKCDIAAKALEPGVQIKFTKGVTGIWENYSFAQCIEMDEKNSGRCDKNKDGAVPGTELTQVYVLHPRDCDDIYVEGMNWDPVATPTTLAALRAGPAKSQFVELSNVVVHFVEQLKVGREDEVLADFWVVDANDPTSGVWVQKFYQDEATGHADANGTQYKPEPGDKLTIRGYYEPNKPNSATPYRPYIRSKATDTSHRLQLELLERGGPEVVPTPVVVPAGFGDAKGGTVAANADHQGALVHFSSELEITNPEPPALKTRDVDGNDSGYNGFEITGGVLVNTAWTKDKCDLRAEALKPGVTIKFENGVTGIWENYSFAHCTELDKKDPTKCRTFKDGVIPGTDLTELYVLYPRSCADITVVPQTPPER